MKKGYVFVAVLAVLSLAFLVSTPAAHADLLFTPSTAGFCCFQVNLHPLGATGVEVTVSLLSPATFFANTGGSNHPGFGFNLDTSISASDITVAAASQSQLSTFHTTATGNTSPNFGSFDYWFEIADPGTSGQHAGPLVFDVAGVTVNNFVQNAAGYFFVADILGQPPASTNGGLSTGLSAIKDPPTGTPEPASLLLIGSGLLGLAALRRRK